MLRWHFLLCPLDSCRRQILTLIVLKHDCILQASILFVSNSASQNFRETTIDLSLPAKCQTTLDEPLLAPADPRLCTLARAAIQAHSHRRVGRETAALLVAATARSITEPMNTAHESRAMSLLILVLLPLLVTLPKNPLSHSSIQILSSWANHRPQFPQITPSSLPSC